MSTWHVMHAGAPGDTWQNGPPLEWLAKIARPPTPSQELAGPKLPSLGAISEEPELHLSNSGGQCAPQIPSLFLVRPDIKFIIFNHKSDVKDHESSTQGHVIKLCVSVIRESCTVLRTLLLPNVPSCCPVHHTLLAAHKHRRPHLCSWRYQIYRL